MTSPGPADPARRVPSSNASELHQAWSPQVPVSTRTVCRILSRNGLHGRISAQKTALNERQLKNHVAFVKAHSLLNEWTWEKWQKVDFSDESSVELQDSRRKYCWRPTGACMDLKFTQKTVKSLVVERSWSGVTFSMGVCETFARWKVISIA